MVSFNDEGNFSIHTDLDAEVYAATIKGLVKVLDCTVSSLWSDGITPTMADAICYTFWLLENMLPTDEQAKRMFDKNTPTGK
jgi:hypothetical protein